MDEWKLSIDILDVGLGECTLVCTWNDQEKSFRSVLIDTGGTRPDTNGKDAESYADDIVSNITKKLTDKSGDHKKEIYKLDSIILTHFNKNHHGGIIDLLASDNITTLISFIAEIISDYTSKEDLIKLSKEKKVCYCTGITYCLLIGVFDDPNKETYKYGKILDSVFDLLDDLIEAGKSENYIADYDTETDTLPELIDKGLKFSLRFMDGQKGNFIEPESDANVLVPESQRDFYIKKIVTAVMTVFDDKEKEEKDQEKRKKKEIARKKKLIKLIVTALNEVIKDTAGLPEKKILDTQCVLSTSKIIDVQDKTNLPAGYEDTINGKVNLNDTIVTVPGIKRERITNPDLGKELLGCHEDNNDAPDMYVIARGGEIWNGGEEPFKIEKEGDDTSISHLGIALLICFKEFQYYSGANLSYKADYNISKIIMDTDKMHKLNGREYYSPKCIAAFKCGNYGTNTYKKIDEVDGDKSFLNRIKPKAAFISCGWYDEDHPSQAFVNELVAAESKPLFYLTGCKKDLKNIYKNTYMGFPRRSRVSGFPDECVPGNIAINVEERNLKDFNDESKLRGSFSVTYYESASFDEDSDSAFTLGYIKEEISF